MADNKEKVELNVQPTSSTDLERRLDAGFDVPVGEVDPKKVNAPYATEDTDTSGYVGVSAEYMTHADVRQRPFRADGGTEQRAEEYALGDAPKVRKPVKVTGKSSQPTQNEELVYTATSGEDYSAELVGTQQPSDTQGTTAVPAPVSVRRGRDKNE